jgi:hypothetical protein
MHRAGELAEELIDAGLLRRGDQPGAYRMERLVRAFAMEAGAPPDDHNELPLRIDVPVPKSRPGTSGWDTYGVFVRHRPARA